MFREYYWFPVKPGQEPAEAETNKRTRYYCPGCNRALTEDAMREHECHGGSEAWPKLRKAQKYTQLTEEEKQLLLRQYQASNPNVTISVDKDKK